MSVCPGGVLVRKKDSFLSFFTIKLLSRLDHAPEGQGQKGREGAGRSAGGEQVSEGDRKADPLLGCSRGDPPPPPSSGSLPCRVLSLSFTGSAGPRSKAACLGSAEQAAHLCPRGAPASPFPKRAPRASAPHPCSTLSLAPWLGAGARQLFSHIPDFRGLS